MARDLQPQPQPQPMLLLLVLVLALAVTGGPRPGTAMAQGALTTGESGLPLPRFVSLKAEPVNMRKGPGTQFPTAWVLRRAGMPLEIVREYEAWREVRDAEGTTGWILGSLLSGRRTAVVQPWDRSREASSVGTLISLHEARSERSRAVAKLESGTDVAIDGCDGTWCAARLLQFRGFVLQKALWGVYPSETIE